MRQCVFTVLVNDYVDLYDNHTRTPGWDHICITDDWNLKSNFWDIMVIPNPSRTPTEHVKLSRYWKTHLHSSLQDYDRLLYIDSRIGIIQEVNRYAAHLDNCDAAFMRHHSMDSIEQQYKVVLQHGYETEAMVQRLRRRYAKHGYKYDNGLIEGGIVLFRNNRPALDFLHDWWTEIRDFSHRDQLSANFVLWMHRDRLNYKIVDNPLYSSDQQFRLLPRKHKRLKVNQ